MTYGEFHQRVVEAVRKNLTARWSPSTEADHEHLERQVAFLDKECDYHDEFESDEDPDRVAESNIDAADWE